MVDFALTANCGRKTLLGFREIGGQWCICESLLNHAGQASGVGAVAEMPKPEQTTQKPPRFRAGVETICDCSGA
jgi:hypothetical protein